MLFLLLLLVLLLLLYGFVAVAARLMPCCSVVKEWPMAYIFLDRRVEREVASILWTSRDVRWLGRAVSPLVVLIVNFVGVVGRGGEVSRRNIIDVKGVEG